MAFIRVYLVPFDNKQQIIDIPDTALVLSNNQFVPVQVASSVTLVGVPISTSFTPFNSSQLPEVLNMSQTQDIRICWREPVTVQTNSDAQVIEVTDPTGGQCVCGITCQGTVITYVRVTDVTPH